MSSELVPTVYAPVGRCIYCGAQRSRADRLSKEHIVPYGLAGNWMILPQASCEPCRTITGKVERFCQREMLGAARIRMKLPTRNPKERRSTLPLDLIRTDGRHERIVVPSEDALVMILGFRFPPPGLLRGVPPAENFDGELLAKPLVEVGQGDAWRKRLTPEGQRVRVGTIGMLVFARMLAKIAHAYAVAHIGLDQFAPYLPDLILGRSTTAPYLVGGDPHPLEAQTNTLHHVYRQDCLRGGVNYVIVAIQLFAFMGMPRYHVVAGERLGWIRA